MRAALYTHIDKLRDIQVCKCKIQLNVQVRHSLPPSGCMVCHFHILSERFLKTPLPHCLFSNRKNITRSWWKDWNDPILQSMSLCSRNSVGEIWNIIILLPNSLRQSVCKRYFGAYYSSFLFGLLMLQTLSLWDMESMLTKQTGWCYMMSSREHIECSTGLIYIGLALRQKGLFIKMTTTTLLGLVAR